MTPPPACSQLQPYISSRLLGTNPISLIDGAYLSPAADTLVATSELFNKFPPAFVTGGAKEILLEQIREAVRRLKLSGVQVGEPFISPSRPSSLVGALSQ